MENWTLKWSRLLPLQTTEINNIPTGLSGVYRLSKKAADEKYYVFYVGKAADIKNRFLEHLSESETNAGLKQKLKSPGDVAFRYAVVTKEEIRSAAERQMYKYYAPECNIQEPEGSSDIQVNLN